MTKLQGYIRLTRPANLPTAMADIIAGAAVGFTLLKTELPLNEMLMSQAGHLFLLIVASVFLYASGVVLNDFFDRKTDAVERPERPIPSGVVTPTSALTFGLVLMILALVISFQVSFLSGVIAAGLALGILLYDALAKNHVFFGPLTMGCCRGMNLLLGMSLLGSVALWWLSLIPVLYIGAITLVSRGEVNGRNKTHITMAFFMYFLVLVFLVGLGMYTGSSYGYALPFIVVFASMVYVPLWNAFKKNTPGNIRKAVKAGVISLILLDACIAVIFAGWALGLSIIVLLPLSLFLARQFAVT